jgi:hypothetical protein
MNLLKRNYILLYHNERLKIVKPQDINLRAYA